MCNPEELSIKVIWLILHRVYQSQLLADVSMDRPAAGRSNGKQEWQHGPGEAVPEQSTSKMSAHESHHGVHQKVCQPMFGFEFGLQVCL